MGKFVVVNGRILDYAVYKKDFALLRKIVALDLQEYSLKLGFKCIKARRKENFFGRQITFYNESLDFEITVSISKRQKEIFV